MTFAHAFARVSVFYPTAIWMFFTVNVLDSFLFTSSHRLTVNRRTVYMYLRVFRDALHIRAVAIMAPWPLATLARCVARSLTYSWVYGTINPLRDSLITEVIKHLNVQTRWAPDDVYAFATRRGRQASWLARGQETGRGRRARQAVTN